VIFGDFCSYHRSDIYASDCGSVPSARKKGNRDHRADKAKVEVSPLRIHIVKTHLLSLIDGLFLTQMSLHSLKASVFDIQDSCEHYPIRSNGYRIEFKGHTSTRIGESSCLALALAKKISKALLSSPFGQTQSL